MFSFKVKLIFFRIFVSCSISLSRGLIFPSHSNSYMKSMTASTKCTEAKWQLNFCLLIFHSLISKVVPCLIYIFHLRFSSHQETHYYQQCFFKFLKMRFCTRLFCLLKVEIRISQAWIQDNQLSSNFHPLLLCIYDLCKKKDASLRNCLVMNY